MTGRARAVRTASAALALAVGLLGALVVVPQAYADDPPEGTTTQTQSAASAASQPLVVVMDLSGSMNDDDGAGTVKLEGAKVAITDVVRKQPPGSEIGLWTYPEAGTDCAPGSYVSGADLQRLADPADLIASIRALEAVGGTPTGAALQAVADDLSARGVTAATILLVSDGESNCDPPPCEVAQEIVDSGFDISVHAMGFQISSQGRDELDCIATVTDGRYYDIEDSEQLALTLEEIGVPQLTIDVTAPTSVPAGSGTQVTAVVSNPSAQDARDVVLSLVFTDQGSRSLFPAVIPPRVRLGNIPAGESLTRTWTLSTAGGATGTADYRVSAWGADILATGVTGTIRIVDAALTIGDAGPILAEAVGHGPLVILGDSYSSGEGSGDYLEGATERETWCHRSLNTYGVTLFGRDNTEIVACSGAVTGNLFAPNADRDVDAQLRRLADDEPGIVALTIGGNDIGFADVVKKCVKPADCTRDTTWTASTFTRIELLQTSLEGSYRAAYGALNNRRAVDARDGRVVPIVVLAYPQVLPDWQRATCRGFTQSEVRFGNDVVARLNEVIGASVEAVAADGVPVYFAGNVQQAVLPRHTACDPEPFINDIGLLRGIGATASDWVADKNPWVENPRSAAEFVHPNARGYQAVTNALVAWSQTVEADAAQASGPQAEEPLTVGSSKPTARIELSGSGDATVRVRAGDAVEVAVDGLAPGSSVTITVHSAPRAIASWRADESGRVDGVAYVPPDLPAGAHTLVASGLDPDDGLVEHAQALTVLPQRPWWLWPLGALSAVALIGAVTTIVVVRRRLTTSQEALPSTA